MNLAFVRYNVELERDRTNFAKSVSQKLSISNKGNLDVKEMQFTESTTFSQMNFMPEFKV